MPTVPLPAAPLNGGVSTQPPANRFATQTETSDNTTLFLNRGLEKRYGSTYVSDLDYTGGFTSVTTHWVRRSDDLRYMIVVDKDASGVNVVQVFEDDGTKLSVTLSAAAETYITAGSKSAKDGLKFATYGDTTFILNTEVNTAKTGTATGYTLTSTVDELAVPPSSLSVGNYVNLTASDVGYPVGIYKVIATSGPGPYYERQTADADNSEINADTFPMRLVFTFDSGGAHTIDVDVAPWNDRLSGDDTLNPGPSFLGSPLTSIAIFQDRLWLGGTSVATSQSGDLYNLWIDDWTTVVDSDPIDLELASSSVAGSEFMVPFDKTLLVIADGSQQWEIQALSAFTPGETNLVDTTNYTVSRKAEPVKIANQLYFMSDQGNYSFMWEYFPNFDRDANIGENVAKHVEEYIPQNVTRMAASENNNMVFMWSEEEQSNLYVYYTSWQVNQKVQSAWARWVMDDDLTIFSFDAFDNDLYIVYKDSSDNLWLETIPITPPPPTTDGSGSGIGYHALVDRKEVYTGVYDPGTKVTTFTLDYLDPNMDTVILGDQWGDRTGQEITSTTDEAGGVTTLQVSGDFSTYPCIVGKSYTMSCQLSPPFVKNEQNMPVMGSLNIRTLDILFEDSVSFDVTVTPRGRAPKVRRFSSSRYGSAIFGQQAIQDYGKFNVKVRGDASDTAIVLSNSTPFPSLFTNLEYICGFVPARTNPTKR